MKKHKIKKPRNIKLVELFKRSGIFKDRKKYDRKNEKKIDDSECNSTGSTTE